MIPIILWPFTALGIFLVVLWVRFLKQPGVDSSNIFNPLRFTWFALTRPDKFFSICPWLQSDEWENVTRDD